MKQKLHDIKADQSGLTLVEVLTALLALAILLTILGTALDGYLSVYNSSQGLSYAQSSIQQTMLSLRGLVSDITPCPGSSRQSGFITAPSAITPSSSWQFSATVPTPTTPTSNPGYSPIEVITISDSNGTLTAKATPCPQYNGPGNLEFFTVPNFVGSSLSYMLYPSSSSTWPYPTQTSVASPGNAQIVGVNISLTFKSGSGSPITVSTTVAVKAFTCDQPVPPSTAPGACV
jgi:prepilin-type N-terminal cleavage/methylation domain-containing protein